MKTSYMRRTTAFVGLTIAITALTCSDDAEPVAAIPEDLPNIIVMLVDNVGYGDVGAFQGGEVRGMPTPRIEQLASEGLVLTQHLTEPGCTPSRAGLMTGRYSHRSGLGTIIIGGTPNTLQAEEVTMAELLKTRGYKTAMFGKWHLGSEEQSWPVRQGFDEYGVGVLETTDSTMYRPLMERSRVDEAIIGQVAPGIWEGTAEQGLRKVREYDIAYRRQVEGDIAANATRYIGEHANDDEPFFLYVAFTHSHYPSVTAPEFTGVSRSGPYGDAIMELDYRTGEVLDAIDQAGIRDDTIVVWLSDDGASPVGGPPEYRGGSNGMFDGEVGDGKEGSLRTPAIVRWPGEITPGKTNGMVSIHDFYTTFASIVGAEVPVDRAIDGVDQSAFFRGEAESSARDNVLTFIGTDLVAVRYKQFRIYATSFVSSQGNPSMPGLLGNRLPQNAFPSIFNVEQDPRESNDLGSTHAWVLRDYMRLIGEYRQTLEQDPNPPMVRMTDL